VGLEIDLKGSFFLKKYRKDIVTVQYRGDSPHDIVRFKVAANAETHLQHFSLMRVY